jgi:hypothetical protein
VVVSLTALVSSPAAAVDRFEIQVYDGTANAPGVVSLENHVNFVDRGSSVSEPPIAPTDHQAHWTFEGALGMTRVWEAGAYLQTAVVPGVGYTFAGAKLRSKFVTPPRLIRNMRLGANFEIAGIPERFEEDRWSVEIRPIVALTLPKFLFAINPILGVPLSSGARDGPHFEPALSAKGRLSERVALGLEYYAGLGPLGAVLPAREQDHYLFGAGDYDLGAGFDLNLGVGVGISEASDPLTFKAIVAYEFGRIF